MTQINKGIRKESFASPIVVDAEKGIYAGEFQKDGTMTAQLRQKVTTKSFYPSKRVDSNLTDNLFAAEDFGFTEQEFTSVEERVTWMLVPPNSTVEDIQARIVAAEKKGARLYRVLSNSPILDDNQKYGIQQGLRTMDDYANSQIARYPKNEQTIADGTAECPILDENGNVFYRRAFFALTAKEDMDLRSATAETYMSPEIAAELEGASVLAGQTLGG